jgi:hypothetical protein
MITGPVLDWLLDSDPALRWQVLRDLTDAPPEAVAAERARVATTGAGAALLGLQNPAGTWAGVAWNRGWNSTMHVLTLLGEFGLPPDCDAARRALGLVSGNVTWSGCGPAECDSNPFFDGETEPCINAQVAAAGAYFGQDVRLLIARLLEEQLPDGGWNCEAPDRSRRSSFNTTLCVLEALLAAERSQAAIPGLTAARLRGQHYLLERRLLRRLSTGEFIAHDRKSGASWTHFAFPVWWHYDVLRALDYLRDAAVPYDERLAYPLALLRSKCDSSGRWPLDLVHPGVMPIDLGERPGQPSRWLTLHALRVLHWFAPQA